MDIDQHSVIVVQFQPRFDFFVERAEQRADVTVSLDFKETPQAVPMSVQVAALVHQRFVAMSRVELVVFLNDHGRAFLLNGIFCVAADTKHTKNERDFSFRKRKSPVRESGALQALAFLGTALT
jgi:hypothetical protein